MLQLSFPNPLEIAVAYSNDQPQRMKTLHVVSKVTSIVVPI
ncbi:TPA: hypothetical protein ACX6SR_003811 [Photobacterium damselae]